MNFGKLLGAAMPLMLAIGCDDIVPSCKLEKVDINADVFVVNGEMDAGFMVGAVTKRTAQDGQVTLTVTLSSTEGDVSKRRTVFLKKDKFRTVNFQFHEPTINAQQVTANATCKVG